MHLGAPGYDDLKLYPVHLILYFIYPTSYYKSHFNSAMFLVMQGSMQQYFCLPGLFYFNIQCSAQAWMAAPSFLDATSFRP